MTIEIKEENYYTGLWRADLLPPNDEGDFLACLYKDRAIDRWVLTYRFRYYKDGGILDTKDTKTWYTVKSKDGAPEAEEEMKAVMMALLEKGGEEGQLQNVVWMPCNGYGREMAKIMLNPERPWLHAKAMTLEEYAEYERTGKVPEGFESEEA